MATNNATNTSNPITIAQGGTSAASFSTSTGLVKYDGTSLVTSTTAKLDASNNYTNTAQPSFAVNLGSNVTNVTGDGTVYPILFDTVVYDQASNITLNSSGKTIFTAPIAGKYLFTFLVSYAGLSVLHTIGNMILIGPTHVAAQQYATYLGNMGLLMDANGFYSTTSSYIVNMSASDTVFIETVVYNGAKTVDIISNNGVQYTTAWMGSLLT